MSDVKVTEGRIVKFTPSERTRDSKFETKNKKSYPAIVTDVNDDSVDLTVFGVRENVYVSNVKHSSEAEAERSHWDWPTQAPDKKKETSEDN